MSSIFLQLLACPVCAADIPSRVAWLLPAIFAAPYLISAVVIRFVRRLE
ncbi:MAG: hypothetical protein ACLQDQ_01985 [Myxococcaceae bacterium]